jgi:aminoglycoside phosphotransferase (APT) family kinase protein
VPICYQIQSCVKGTDLGCVIATLNETQLGVIAESVVDIFQKLRPVATNGRFGYIYGDDSGCRDSWSEVIRDLIAEVEHRNAATSVVGAELLRVAKNILNHYQPYFDSVSSTCFYDDISSKNVLVHDGSFTGIVDLDGIAYGDPLEAVGRIKASWFGTRHGHEYLAAIERGLNLTRDPRNVVTAYAVLHRICWLSEKGIQWNRNTSTAIDPEAVKSDNAMIAALRAEMRI